MLQEAINNLTGEQAKELLRQLSTNMPRDVHSVLLPTPDYTNQPQENPPPFCSCVEGATGICCQRTPCITTTATFNDICQKTNVIEVCGVSNYCDQFHDVPTYVPKDYRNQAYRFFTLWQHGRLGRGNRVPLPACAMGKIRWKFPQPDGIYRNFQPGDGPAGVHVSEDDEDDEVV